MNVTTTFNNYYVIILPFYNEENLIYEFIQLLIKNLDNLNENFILLFINDGSSDSSLQVIKTYKTTKKNIQISILDLKNNYGQQNAIKTGLKYIKKNLTLGLNGVITMDTDGEDNPEAIKEIIKLKSFEIIFISRGKRQESFTFKIGYFIYKIIFKLITGKKINFGNYSLINPTVLQRISDENFYHYSAFLSKQKYKIEKIKYDRNKRIFGNSKMGYKNLIIHALKSLIEYFEELIIFQIKVFILITIIFISALSYILYAKFISNNAIIGWSSNILIGLINGMLIMFSSIIISTLLLIIRKTQDNQINRTKQ
jgi:glycosyltransferase involved in cell wall biosynthesis